MIGYIATVVAISVPVSWTCVRLAIPLLKRGQEGAAAPLALASTAAYLMCIIAAVWAAMARAALPAASLAMFWAIASSAMVVLLRAGDAGQPTTPHVTSQHSRPGGVQRAFRALACAARAAVSRAAAGVPVATPPAPRRVTEVAAAADKPADLPRETRAPQPPEIHHIANDDIEGQLRSVMAQLCKPDVVRDPDKKRQLIEAQRRLHAMQSAQAAAAANSGVDPNSVERCYTQRTDRLNALLGRELTDDSHT